MEENNEIQYTYQDFLDALSARDFKLAEKISLEIGQEIPIEYLDDLVHELNTDIADEITLTQTTEKTAEPTYDKIYITNQTTQEELLKYISNNAKNKQYSVVIFTETPKFKNYVLAREDAFSYYNFKDPKEAEGVKDLYNSISYIARGAFNNRFAAVMQETTKTIKYHLLKSVKDKDDCIRPELPRLEEKDVSIDEKLELIIEEGNFEKPGLLLPEKNYDWKLAITKK